MQRLVALKISTDKGREHQMLAQLDHPHIVRVYDHRVIEDPPARLMYMQHIAGGTLQDVVREARQLAGGDRLTGRHLVAAVDKLLSLRGESIPVRSENRRWLQSVDWPTATSRLGSEIARALAYAHHHEVLHRDLKPANVLLDQDCHVKLVDFNISFCSKLDGVTPAAYFGGSMAYMSPEQLEACSPDHDRSPAELDGRSDLYSLGILLMELGCGERPFEDRIQPGDWGGTLSNMIAARRAGVSDHQWEQLGDASPLLVQALRRALAPDPEQRFSDAGALARYLELASDREAESLFVPRTGGWSTLARHTVFWAAGLATLCISAAAVLFIISYNWSKSVPAAGLELFQWYLVPWINLVIFPAGAAIIWALTRPVARTLGRYRAGETISGDQWRHAMRSNFLLGHHIAIMCIVAWSYAGLLFPAILTLAGHGLSPQAWFDFFVSHLLAGLIAGSYAFWMVTWCALYVWLPELLNAALDHDRYADWSPIIRWLQRLAGFYHVLAVAAPLLAIAWLVLYHNSADKSPLAFVSLVSLLGLAVLVWVSRGVQDRLAGLEAVAGRLAGEPGEN
jgi:hypothetical protein